MNNDPVRLLIAAFDDEQAAGDALKQLKEARKEGQVDFTDIAVVRRDEKNRLHVKEIGDTKAGKGALAGGLTGAVLGALAGPPGLVAGGIVGALAGAGITAPDTGIPDERLTEIGRALSPGTSAIVVITQDEGFEPLKSQLEPLAAEIFAAEVDAAIAEQLAATEDTTYKVAAPDSGPPNDQSKSDE